MKILNLDELDVGLEKSIVLNGKTHVMQPFQVRDYVELLKTIKEGDDIEKSPVATTDDLVTQMVKGITKSFPTLTEDEILDLPLPKIRTIYEFIQAVVQAENEQGNE